MVPVVVDLTLLQVVEEVEVDLEPLCLADLVVEVLQNLLFQYQHLQDLILLLLGVVAHLDKEHLLHLEMELMELEEETQHLVDPHLLM